MEKGRKYLCVVSLVEDLISDLTGTEKKFNSHACLLLNTQWA